MVKDLPHHIKKLNRKIVRSEHRDEMAEENFDAFNAAYRKDTTHRRQMKEKKLAQRNAERNHIPSPKSDDEKNDLRRHRTPQTRDRTRRSPHAKPYKGRVVG